MKIKESWGELYKQRKLIRKRYPEIWSIKIIKKHLQVLSKIISENAMILDIGAYDRSLEGKIKKIVPSAVYRSMDVDIYQKHDYYDLSVVKEKFNVIVLFEVIEHLEYEEGINMLEKIYHLLDFGGKLLLTTPNLFHPNRYWDASHRVPYRYDEIAAVVSSTGLHVKEIYRIYNDAFFRRILRMYVFSFLHHYLDIDFAKSILLIAEKKPE
ncbi:MAG: hypothetical protein SV062_05125 [Thermodesulfobacteriota bacterium]|nr:hypothetical protein [Thermodesulfobacteriota bacterium]